MSSPSFNLLQGDPTTWGVPPVGKTFVGINLSEQLVLVNNNGSGGQVITPVVSAAPAGLAFANASGSTTITPSAGVTTAVGAITGGARSVPLVLATNGMSDGQTVEVFLTFPAIDGLTINFYNTVGSGSPVLPIQVSAISGITNALAKFLFQSSTGLWLPISLRVPAL